MFIMRCNAYNNMHAYNACAGQLLQIYLQTLADINSSSQTYGNRNNFTA